MTAYPRPATMTTPAVAAPPTPSSFTVPARHNPRLQKLVERINADDELRQLWRCANINMVERGQHGDHGETHMRIVANAALRLLRLLMEGGLTPSVMTHHHLPREEAEVIVVLSAALHDVGHAAHPLAPASLGLVLAERKARDLLTGLYPARERTIVLAETLHAIHAHLLGQPGQTLESHILRLADALDMTHHRQGTGRLPAQPGGISEVNLVRGHTRPVRVEVRLHTSAALPLAQQAIQRGLHLSPLLESVELVALAADSTAPPTAFTLDPNPLLPISTGVLP